MQISTAFSDDLVMPSAQEQIEAILTYDIFRWAQEHLPAGKTIEDIRFPDLISVTPDDVFALGR